MRKAIVLLALISLAAFKSPETATWTVDKAHAKVGFTATHMMVSDVEGWFKSFDAKITTTKDDFSDAVAELTIQVGSINTDNEMRDGDLKSDKFFDAAKFPMITFKSKKFTKTGEKTYKVIGDINIHGVTKPIELNVTCNVGTNPMNKKTIAGFKITGTLKRSDFGVGTSVPGAIVSDEITLLANTEFDKD